MKTDDLIVALATGAEPVDPRMPSRRMLVAAVAGVALAVPLMFGMRGLNPLLAQAASAPMFWIKLAFVTATAAAAFAVALKLGRPGAAVRRSGVALVIPFVSLWLLAAVVLVVSAPGDRQALPLGSTCSACPLNIAVLSAPAPLLSMWAMRGIVVSNALGVAV